MNNEIDNTLSRRLRCIFGVVALMLFVPAVLRAQEPFVAGGAELRDPYSYLATELSRYVLTNAASIGLGNFVYENTEQMSPFSSLLRDQLKVALSRNPRFKLITREALADLQKEGQLQSLSILDPGAQKPKIAVKGVEGIVRGRFFYKYPDVTVFAELMWLDGGEVKSVQVVVPAKDVGAQIWPANQPDQVNKERISSAVVPQNVEKSGQNISDVENRIKSVPCDFDISLSILEGKRDFAEGETISYRIHVTESCHVAVFCHQVDGSTVVLFPNPHSADTFVQKDKDVQIPGTSRSGFELVIGPPYGADVVQVIACTKRSHLHQMLADFAKEDAGKSSYRGLTRGIFVQGIEKSLSESEGASEPSGPPRWSESHIVVSTYPKY